MDASFPKLKGKKKAEKARKKDIKQFTYTVDKHEETFDVTAQFVMKCKW